jgi:hypothetical protein
MSAHFQHTYEVTPTPDQVKALALQLVFVNKVIQACPDSNPFGPSVKNFTRWPGCEKVRLWSTVGNAMMGFSSAVLRQAKWKRQFNIRGPVKGFQHFPDGTIYISPLATECGNGALVPVTPQACPLPNAKTAFITVRLDEDKRWWVTEYLSNRPGMKS